jgi:hypothetical protein
MAHLELFGAGSSRTSNDQTSIVHVANALERRPDCSCDLLLKIRGAADLVRIVSLQVHVLTQDIKPQRSVLKGQTFGLRCRAIFLILATLVPIVEVLTQYLKRIQRAANSQNPGDASVTRLTTSGRLGPLMARTPELPGQSWIRNGKTRSGGPQRRDHRRAAETLDSSRATNCWALETSAYASSIARRSSRT